MKDRKYLLYLALPFLLIVGLILLGNVVDFSQYPSAAADGSSWDKSWEMLGKTVGIAQPGHDLTLQTNNSVLAGEETYYASWTIGEASTYTNEDGDEVDLYPAQLYLLLYGCADADSARDACTDFLDRERQTYDIQSEETAAHNGQDYTVLHCNCISASNPYDRGCSAFTVYGDYVFVAELTCQESFDGDVGEILSDVLDGVHYSADLS